MQYSQQKEPFKGWFRKYDIPILTITGLQAPVKFQNYFKILTPKSRGFDTCEILRQAVRLHSE